MKVALTRAREHFDNYVVVIYQATKAQTGFTMDVCLSALSLSLSLDEPAKRANGAESSQTFIRSLEISSANGTCGRIPRSQRPARSVAL